MALKAAANLMAHHLDDDSVIWLEWQLQAAIVVVLRREEIAFEVGLEGVRLSKGQRGKAKVQGMEPGRCDLRLYCHDGKMVHIELKKKGGYLSDAQKEWHQTLRELGHTVYTVTAKTPYEAINKVLAIYIEVEDVL